jgi:hypothetical protein
MGGARSADLALRRSALTIEWATAARGGHSARVNAVEIDAALQDVFDQAIVFHAYTDYMRDYEILTFAVADPRTGIPPAYDRYLFKICVEVEIGTAVSVETWSRSLDDRLLNYEDYETGTDLDGFVWGVKWQCLYPGGRVVPDSERARRWSTALGIPFHEVRIETNCHDINLVFSDLEVTRVEPGYAPFVVASEDNCAPPTPLAHDE